MSVIDTAENLETQVLDTIRQGQDIVVAAVSSVVQAIEPVLGDVPMPFADRLPTPVAVVDNAFGFAEKLLRSQHEYATRLLEAAAPLFGAKATPAPAPVKVTKTA